MKQLIKQVLKSFKHSLFLIISLVFIAICIIFSSFSLLYLNKNTNDSINNLNKYGNSSNSVIEKKYDIRKPSYITNDFNNLKSVNHTIYVSNFSYKSGERNIIFPYNSTDFSSPDVNAKPWNRKNGIIRTTPGETSKDEFGNTIYNLKTISSTNLNDWTGLGWSMSNAGGGQIFFPENLVFNYDDSGNQKLVGNYNASTKKIEKNFSLLETTYRASKNSFTEFDTSSTTDLSININTPIVFSKPIDVDMNLVAVSKDAELYSVLYRNIKTERNPFYQFGLDLSSLSNLQLEMLNVVFTPEERSGILNGEFLLKDSWIGNTIKSQTGSFDGNTTSVQFNNFKKEILESLVEQREEELLNEFNNRIDDYFDKFAKINNIDYSNEKSFSTSDQSTSFNYIVANKENNSINKIVYTGGSKLVDSTKYLDVVDNITYATEYFFSSNKFMFNLIQLMVSSRDGLETIDPVVIRKIEKIINNYNNNEAIDYGDYKYIFAIYQPEYELSKFVSTNEQNIKLKFNYLYGISQLKLEKTLLVETIYSNAVVVPEKYLNALNKEFLPIEIWNEWVNKWNSLKDSWDSIENTDSQNFSVEFRKWISTLDSKYLIEINTYKFVIIGSGLSPEMAYPSYSLENLIINAKNEMLIYVNNQGYRTILSTVPTIFQNDYYSTKIDTKKISIDNFDTQYRAIFNQSSNEKLVVDSSDFQSNQSILSFRISLPKSISFYVTVVALTIIIILIALGLYLAYLLIKSYITKNQVQLAIIKANGFSNFKICIAVSFFGLVVSVFAGTIGYVIAFFLQSIFFSVVSPFWFIHTTFLPFSLLGFFGGCFVIFSIFFAFTYLILKITFRKPINELIAQTTEIKISKALTLLKNNVIKVGPLFKFRLSLSLCNVWRLVFYTILCSTGLSLISIAFSVPEKFTQSTELTSLNKKYAYSFYLTTPTEQGGLYKLQKYSNLGFTDVDNGIYPLYDGELNGVTYTNVSKYKYPYTIQQLKVFDPITGNQKKDENGKPLYFANIMLPSYNASFALQYDSTFLMNAVFSKWLFDIDIPQVGLNVWEFVKSSLPAEIISRAETQDQIFLKSIYNSTNKFIKDDLEKYKFIIYDQQTNLYKVNSEQAINDTIVPEKIGFRQTFLDFIGKVYGDEDLSNKDVKLSYGIIPYNENTETLTVVNAKPDFLKDNSKVKSINLIGIKPDSKYIQLKNNSSKEIFDLLNDEDALIINNGAAYKYKLNVGDTVNIDVLNSYFRYSEVIANKELNHNYKLKVVGISSASFGEEFYVSQNLANKLTNLSKQNETESDFTGGKIISHYGYDQSKKSVTKYYADKLGSINSVPFNAIITDDSNTFFLRNNINFYSLFGLWPMITETDSLTLKNFLVQVYTNNGNYSAKSLMLNNMISYNPSLLSEQEREQLYNDINTKFPDTTELAEYILSVFSNKPISIVLNNIDSYLTTQQVYLNLFDSIKTVQALGISIFVPIVIIMILVMTSIMMSEIKTMISILKTLGYSNKENINSILFSYIPILALSLLIGLILLIAIIFVLQYTVYNLSNIFISSVINWLPYIYGSLSLLIILFSNFLIILILFKKTNLKKTITS